MSAKAISRDIRPIVVRLDGALVDTIDSLRGDTPRTVWITRAIEAKMQGQLAPGSMNPAGSPIAGFGHCTTTNHNRAKARHGRCEDCGEKP